MPNPSLNQFYTEIIKIIEGGLKREPHKVAQFARKLAEKAQLEGDDTLAKGVRRLLENREPSTLSLDKLINTAPVDSESRLSIVDIFNPDAEPLEIILSDAIEKRINDFIKVVQQKDKFKSLGLPLQSTLLLHGAPGVGKTSIAKYISMHTGLPLVIARLDSLISSLLGNTAKNIRQVFEYADSKPCILFLDEFDAIAKARDDQHETGELKRVINSLLQNIDHFSRDNMLVAATNHPELLDKAIWRRFNTIIEVGRLDEEGIVRMLQSYLGRFNKDFLVDRKKYDKIVALFALKTPSDIRTIINNVITRTVIENRKTASAEDLLLEIFYFDTHGSYKEEDLVKFLNDNGVTQVQIAELLDVSVRQIRNNLK